MTIYFFHFFKILNILRKLFKILSSAIDGLAAQKLLELGRLHHRLFGSLLDDFLRDNTLDPIGLLGILHRLLNRLLRRLHNRLHNLCSCLGGSSGTSSGLLVRDKVQDNSVRLSGRDGGEGLLHLVNRGLKLGHDCFV